MRNEQTPVPDPRCSGGPPHLGDLIDQRRQSPPVLCFSIALSPNSLTLRNGTSTESQGQRALQGR